MKYIKTYIDDKKFKLNITSDTIHIDNFISITTLEENKIELKFETFNMILDGKKFAIKKLIEREILLTGEIKNIKFE